MIAMQYSFVLPADYDMAIVRERIAVKGKLLDNLPGLIFKAYLHAERGATAMENTYAPFYLWQDEEAMHGFLNGARVCQRVASLRLAVRAHLDAVACQRRRRRCGRRARPRAASPASLPTATWRSCASMRKVTRGARWKMARWRWSSALSR
jgi:hypothetical protein